MKHSLVGGSTAKIVMNCHGSLKLREKMPTQPENEYMARGTLCHKAVEMALGGMNARSVKYNGLEMTDDLYEDKIEVALKLLEQVDPDNVMEFDLEQRVEITPEIFGTTDLVGRLDNRLVILDWKFGDGVMVSAEENEQGLFYAAGVMKTPSLKWAWEGVTEVEIVIIQPPLISRWVTTVERVKEFELDLLKAMKAAQSPDATFKHGEHCRFCSAKPICPVMTGAVDRALKTKIDGLDAATIAAYLKNADLLEDWIKDLRALAFQMIDTGATLPGWKLVAKRGTRKWISPVDAAVVLRQLGIDPMAPAEILSPAQAEKALKKVKQELPDDLVKSESSGNTLAPEDDPRPPVLQIGQQLSAALSKLV